MPGGLNRINRSREEDSRITFTRFREADGLANDNIEAMLEDDRGNLWLGIDGGLTRLDPRTGESRVYTVEDGLSGTDFSSTAIKKSSGEFLFGSRQGLIGFFPDRLADDPHVPRVAITDFRLFNRSVPLSARGFSRSDGGEARLTLSYRDAIFSFEFAALHFAKPGKNRYAYRMEGFNDDWIETDADNRFAQYTNLDSGDYVFRVKAANADGVWNEDGVSMRITVQPPPWKTWWAYSLYGLAFAAVVLTWVRSHREELRRERTVNARLREVDKLKDEFLANTSHELRTPLYGITGLVESLIDGAAGEDPEVLENNLSMIVASGRRLGRLVDDLLDFSKLKQQAPKLDLKPVDLHTVVDMVLALLRTLVSSKNLELNNAIAPDLPLALADEDRLRQILHNLVGNAIKFTEAGQVEVTAAERGGRLAMSVRDTGIGIPEDQQEKIFDAFVQADGTTERQFGGTGLGLTASRQLLQLHGSTLRLESTPGEGTTFFFDLPIAQGEMEIEGDSEARDEPEAPDEPEAKEVSSAVDHAEDRPASAAARPGSARILVVDDERINRQVLVNQLTAEGYHVAQAGSGPEALRQVREQPPDLMLLDVMMPRMSGYEVCEFIRQTHPVEKLPILFLSAMGRDDDRVAGLDHGGNDYLNKPVTKGELLSRVRTHLELLEAHRLQEREVKSLRGLLPICVRCKKIRDDEGFWNQMEAYISQRSEAEFSHGICPPCTEELYPGLLDFKEPR